MSKQEYMVTQRHSVEIEVRKKVTAVNMEAAQRLADFHWERYPTVPHNAQVSGKVTKVERYDGNS
jgi:hypothetical protein